MDARRTVAVVMDDEIVVYIPVEWRLMQIYYETIYSFLSTTFLSLSLSPAPSLLFGFESC